MAGELGLPPQVRALRTRGGFSIVPIKKSGQSGTAHQGIVDTADRLLLGAIGLIQSRGMQLSLEVALAKRILVSS